MHAVRKGAASNWRGGGGGVSEIAAMNRRGGGVYSQGARLQCCERTQ